MARQVFREGQQVMVHSYSGWKAAIVIRPDVHATGWREPYYVEVEVPAERYERAPRKRQILNNRRQVLSLKEYEPVRLAAEAQAAHLKGESLRAEARARARFMAHAYQIMKFNAAKLHAREDIAAYLEEHLLLPREDDLDWAR